MQNLNLRTDFITIGDFQNESEGNKCYYYAYKWRSIQQISYIFFPIFYYFVCTFGGTNFIPTVFSL